MMLLRLCILAGGVATAGGSYAITAIRDDAVRIATHGAYEVILVFIAVTIGANLLYRLVERRVIADLRETWHAIHADDVDDTRG